MAHEEESPTLTVRCLKCSATYPVAVTMDDWGQIIDDPLDFTDFWAHHWTHEVSA
jgi:hypothetical protein